MCFDVFCSYVTVPPGWVGRRTGVLGGKIQDRGACEIKGRPAKDGMMGGSGGWGIGEMGGGCVCLFFSVFYALIRLYKLFI